MFVFVKQIEDMLGGLEDPRAETQVIPDSVFKKFKHFTVKYMQEHDELAPDHPAMEHVMNSTTVDEVEQFLRANLDYCDPCILKLFRRFIHHDLEDKGDHPCA
tara:strand:+ start:2712 stop:3020 length:309 start_codon:yes stop_codon:yes gene_type:complete